MDQLKTEMLKCLKTLPDKEMSVRVHMTAPVIFPTMQFSKNVKRSEVSRNEGNRLFRQSSHDSQTHHKILHLYNESIAYAPNKSEELASAYGNKSAILLHVYKYAESISEADKALKITTSTTLKVKLICRKAECHTALGSSESYNCLEKARFLLAKENPAEELKSSLQDLINKSQSVVNAGRLDPPEIFAKRIWASRAVADAEEKDVWDSVQLEYSKRYGRHLVAARDFEPGEIITVEKSFVTRLLDSRIFLYCYHCFKYLWTVVPCEQCAFRLYCSEKCKDEAWNQHHDMECNVLVKMKEGALFDPYDQIPMIISCFFKSYKEAGGIEQLQTELEILDRYDVDERSKGFPANAKFTSYKSMYLLRSRHFVGDEYESVINSAAIALLGIAKHTDIFGTRYDFKDIKKLRRNDTAIFVGALLFKFAWVIHSRISFALLSDPSEPDRRQVLPIDTRETPMCESLKSLGYLFPLVCVPNCKSTVTYGAKHIMYALQPIKKGTPLTSSIASIYDHVKKPKRLETIKAFYDFTCDCRACIENWFYSKPTSDDVIKELGPDKLVIGFSLLKREALISNKIAGKSQREILSDPTLLLKTKTLNTEAWGHFSMPSTMLLRTTRNMMLVYDLFLTSHQEHVHPCKKRI